MYDLMRVRLWSAGPPGALFNNVIIDLRDSWTDVSGSDGSNERDAAVRPARRIAVVGPYGAGKSTLVRLISSVFVQARPLPGARLVPLEVEQRVGHVALEWRHPRTGDLLITGRVLRHRPEAPVGRTLAWYSFRLTVTSGLESLPFAHDAPSEGLRSFRERLEAALPPTDRASLTWADSYVRWREHLRGLGFAVRWWEWIADHSVHGRARWDWTDDRFIAFVIREAVGDELTGRLGGLVDEYMAVRELGPEVSGVTEDVVRAAKQSVVDLLNDVVQDVLTALRDVQRLSRLPAGVLSGFGGSEFFRVSCEPYDERRADRLPALLDSGVCTHTWQLVASGVRAVADISVEVLAPNESASTAARYLLPSQLDELSRYQADTVRVMSFLVAGAVAARMEQERDGDTSNALGIVVLDELPEHAIVGTHRRVLELVSALGSQFLCTSRRFEPDLLTRFSSIVVIESVGTLGEPQVRVAYPAVLKPASDHGTQTTGMTGAMDRVLLEDVFEVSDNVERPPLSAVDHNVTAARVLAASDIHAQLVRAPVFPQVPGGVREEDLLRPGDFVLSKMWDGRVVPIIAISVDDPPQVLSESVLVLRPRRPLRPGETFFYLRYIESDHLLGALTDQGRAAIVTAAGLRRLLVPRPAGATLTAITHLTSAADTFRAWQSDADDAIRSFFEWADPETARSRMIEAGRLTRQRREAVSMVNLCIIACSRVHTTYVSHEGQWRTRWLRWAIVEPDIDVEAAATNPELGTLWPGHPLHRRQPSLVRPRPQRASARPSHAWHRPSGARRSGEDLGARAAPGGQQHFSYFLDPHGNTVEYTPSHRFQRGRPYARRRRPDRRPQLPVHVGRVGPVAARGPIALPDGEYAYGFTLSPNGNVLTTVGSGGIMRWWDIVSNNQTRPPVTADFRYVSTVTFNSEGTYFAALDGHTLTVWELDTGKRTGTTLSGVSVSAVAFCPDGMPATGDPHGTRRLSRLPGW